MNAQRSIVMIIIETLIALAILICGALKLLPFGGIPLLVIVSGVSLWLRGVGTRELGIEWQRLTIGAVGLGIAFGVVYQALSLLVLEPSLAFLTGERPDLSSFAAMQGNARLLILDLAIAWVLAAFGEEFVFRGYLFNRIAELLPGRRAGFAIAIVVTAILWSLEHIYQGIGGVTLLMVHGITYGLLYLLTGRNLWVTIIAHGVHDTVGLLLVFFGKYPNLGA